MTDRIGNTCIAIAGLMLSFGVGVVLASPPDLPKDFKQAASVGQITPKQAAKACFAAQTATNRQILDARGDNKFAPNQFVEFHCEQASVYTEPAPATLTPGP